MIDYSKSMENHNFHGPTVLTTHGPTVRNEGGKSKIWFFEADSEEDFFVNLEIYELLQVAAVFCFVCALGFSSRLVTSLSNLP